MLFWLDLIAGMTFHGKVVSLFPYGHLKKTNWVCLAYIESLQTNCSFSLDVTFEISGFKFHDTKYVTPVTFCSHRKSSLLYLQFTCGLDTLTESGC